jgi:hypothetical protein
VKNVLTWLARLPTTQARVAVTLSCVVATTARYLAGGWEPSWDWLTFLAVMSGLDLTQFAVKRRTEFAPSANGAPAREASDGD